MRVVLAVSRAGSLSGAANLLCVNHATVSRQIARAEADAGQALFDRLPSGMAATEAGQRVAAHAEAIETHVSDLSRALLSHDGGLAGELRVTIAPLLANRSFAEDIAAFQQAHPAINLHILGAERALNLHQREADVAIRVVANPTESLWGRVIARQRGGWFASESFIAAHQTVLESGVGDLPVISLTSWDGTLPEDVVARYSDVRIAARTDDMMTALSLASVGIGMVRTAHVLGMGQAGLVPLRHIPMSDYRPIWLLTHPDLRRVPRVAAFMTFIADRFRARRELFWGPEG